MRRQDTEVGKTNFCREFKCTKYLVLDLWEIPTSKAHACCQCLQRELSWLKYRRGADMRKGEIKWKKN